MKAFSFALAAWIAGTGLAAAQAPVEPPRSDVQVVVGWENLRAPEPQDRYQTWMHQMALAGAGAGWYWDDHLKTQVDFGATSHGRQYGYNEFTRDGVQVVEPRRVAVRRDTLAISQQYQFFRNQWFHPHVGAGVNLARETQTREYQPTVVFDPVTRTSRL